MTARLLGSIAVLGSVLAMSEGPVNSTGFQFDPSGRILIRAHVDGVPRVFVIDTATRVTTVSAALATTLDRPIKETRPGVQTVDDVQLELLGVRLPHQPVRVAPEPLAYDGIVGADLCRRFIVKVDFSSRRITLWPTSARVDSRQAVVVPADFTNDVPIIAATISAAETARSPANLAIGLAVAPDSVAFRYRYADDAGLLDAPQRDGVVSVTLFGITRSAIAVKAPLPREPERSPMLFADGVVSARALSASWIVFDAPHGRIVLGR